MNNINATLKRLTEDNDKIVKIKGKVDADGKNLFSDPWFAKAFPDGMTGVLIDKIGSKLEAVRVQFAEIANGQVVKLYKGIAKFKPDQLVEV